MQLLKHDKNVIILKETVNFTFLLSFIIILSNNYFYVLTHTAHKYNSGNNVLYRFVPMYSIYWANMKYSQKYCRT